MNWYTIFNIVCTFIVIMLTLLNIYLFPIFREKLVESLERDIARILRDKGIF